MEDDFYEYEGEGEEEFDEELDDEMYSEEDEKVSVSYRRYSLSKRETI